MKDNKIKMEIGDYKAFFRGLGLQVILFIVVLFVLYFLAFYTRSGDAAYESSLLFVIAEGIIIGVQYYRWYVEVSIEAANKTNLRDKKMIANNTIPSYLFQSFILSVVCIVVAFILMMFKVILLDASQIFRCSAVLIEAILGNILMVLLMMFWGVPNIVTGR